MRTLLILCCFLATSDPAGAQNTPRLVPARPLPAQAAGAATMSLRPRSAATPTTPGTAPAATASRPKTVARPVPRSRAVTRPAVVVRHEKP